MRINQLYWQIWSRVRVFFYYCVGYMVSGRLLCAPGTIFSLYPFAQISLHMHICRLLFCYSFCTHHKCAFHFSRIFHCSYSALYSYFLSFFLLFYFTGSLFFLVNFCFRIQNVILRFTYTKTISISFCVAIIVILKGLSISLGFLAFSICA